MRALVEVSQNPVEWFQNPTSSQSVALEAQAVFEKVLLLSGDGDYRSLLRGIPTTLEEGARTRIQGFVEVTPLGLFDEDASFRLGVHEGETTTLASLDYEELNKVVAQRSSAREPEEASEEAFTRTIGSILRYARSVQLVDPYFASELFEGKAWMLGKFLEKDIKRVEIISALDYRDTKKIEVIKGELLRLMQAQDGFQGVCNLRILRADSRYFHHRRLRLGFGKNFVYSGLEKGSKSLGKTQVNEPTQIYPLNKEVFVAHKSQVLSKLQLIEEISFDLENL